MTEKYMSLNTDIFLGIFVFHAAHRHLQEIIQLKMSYRYVSHDIRRVNYL